MVKNGVLVVDQDGNPVFQPVYVQKTTQRLDGNGDPVYDENNNPIYDLVFDGEGNPVYETRSVLVVDESNNPVLDEQGNPQYVTEYVEQRDSQGHIIYEMEEIYSANTFEFPYGATDATYIEPDGTAMLHAGETLNFSQSVNNEFFSYLTQFRIDEIEITYAGDNDAYLYDPAAAAGEQTQASGNTAVMTYKVNYNTVNGVKTVDVSGCEVKNFTSSDYEDFDVTVDWIDDGKGRPDEKSISFDIKRSVSATAPTYTNAELEDPASFADGGSLSAYTAYDAGTVVPEMINSNEYVFSYKVPRVTKENVTYDYIALDNKTSFDYPADYPGVSAEDKKEYRYERTDKNYFEYYSKTEYTVNLSWRDDNNALSIRPSLTNENIKSFITSHFDLKIKNANGTDTTIDLTKDKYEIVIDGDKVSIKGLDEMVKVDGFGSAIVYYLEQKTSDTIPAANGTDYYAVSANNSGVYSSITNKIFNDCDAVMLLSGDEVFSGSVLWTDNAMRDQTKLLDNVVSYTLWRYVGDTDHKAQVGFSLLTVTALRILMMMKTEYRLYYQNTMSWGANTYIMQNKPLQL